MRSLMMPKFKQNAAALQHLSAEFNAYCWSDSASRLQSRPEGPADQYCLLLVLSKLCNILLRNASIINWRVWLGLMRVSGKRLTHFLWQFSRFAVSCGFRGGNGNLWAIVASSPFFPAPRTLVSFCVLLSRDFSRLPQMEGFLAGYIYSHFKNIPFKKQSMLFLCSLDDLLKAGCLHADSIVVVGYRSHGQIYDEDHMADATTIVDVQSIYRYTIVFPVTHIIMTGAATAFKSAVSLIYVPLFGKSLLFSSKRI